MNCKAPWITPPQGQLPRISPSTGPGVLSSTSSSSTEYRLRAILETSSRA